MWSRIKSWLAALGGILLVALTGFMLGSRRRTRPHGPEVDRALEAANRAAGEAKATIEQQRERMAERKRRAEDLARRLRALPFILLLALSSCLWSPAVSAQDTLPSDYDTLARLYLEAVDIAAQYKALYEDAERSNERLLAQLEALQRRVEELAETVRRQQELIERQQGTIMGLLRGIRVSAGVSLESLSPPSLTPWVAIAYEF